jgi:PhzF family phenazine biosynthesis protein
MSRRFAQVDVFSESPGGGNPVAVVLDADGLDTAAMQRFAAWTNLSETTFVSPPSAGGDYAVRIFTPDRELPFAGHPTLGTCHAWLEAGGTAGDVITQECGAGPVPIRRDDGRLAFAAPPLVRTGPVEAPLVEELARILGLRLDEVVDAQWVDNGPNWVGLLLGSAERVLAVKPARCPYDVGIVGPCPEGDDAAIEVRAFFPHTGMTVEDPVTGSLNASLAEWLLRTGRVTAPYVARQGTAVGRTGRVHVAQTDDAIWIGGATTTLIAGTVDL